MVERFETKNTVDGPKPQRANGRSRSEPPLTWVLRCPEAVRILTELDQAAHGPTLLGLVNDET